MIAPKPSEAGMRVRLFPSLLFLIYLSSHNAVKKRIKKSHFQRDSKRAERRSLDLFCSEAISKLF